MNDLECDDRHRGQSRAALATDGTAACAIAVGEVIAGLDAGPPARRPRKSSGAWATHQWIKKAVLLSFRLAENARDALRAARRQRRSRSRSTTRCRPSSPASSDDELAAAGRPRRAARPSRAAARSSRSNVVLMPSFVNIGAYVDEGTMVDTWATVGSCAQIGKNVHLSGGVGIGGVLEPLQANPTIIEDNCFIGARSEVVEGVDRRGELGARRWACSSARARRSTTARPAKSRYGRVPAGSVVVAGSLPVGRRHAASLYCAVIVKQVDAQTRAKTSINELLRA